MPDRPRIHIQEKPYSCAPACLLMVLESLGVSKTEEEICALCDCSSVLGSEGTFALNLVDAARALGFAKTRKYTLDIAGLEVELRRGVFPIVYLYTQLSTNDPKMQCHAVVVVKSDGNWVELNDPFRGAVTLSKLSFVEQWQMMNGLTILVE